MAVKTTSLETSKMLKEARFRQDTEYHFYRMSSNEKPFIGSRDITWQNYIIFAAPTTDELLEELPTNLILQYFDDNYTGMAMGDYTDLFRDPNKLADCWLWLKKEGLIK